MAAVLALLALLLGVEALSDVRIASDDQDNIILDAGGRNISLLASHVLLGPSGNDFQGLLNTLQATFQQQLQNTQAVIQQLSSQVAAQNAVNNQLNSQIEDMDESLTWSMNQVCSAPMRKLLNITSLPPILFPSLRAVDVHQFNVDGVSYIAVANQQNTSTNRVVNSEIFRFNGTALVSIQTILTRGNYDIDSVSINGDTYLVFAEYLDTRTTPPLPTTSDIWKWDRATQQLYNYQNITVNQGWAEGASFFHIGNTPYLVIGGRPVMIYVWDWTTNNFAFLQDLTFVTQNVTNRTGYTFPMSIGLYRADFATIGTRGFLALANVASLLNILEFNYTSGLFQPFQQVPSVTTRDVEFASVGSDMYLAIANNAAVPVYIYKWNGAAFVAYQNLSITYTRGVESFSFGGRSYLGVASESGPGTSKVFVWDGAQYVDMETMSMWPFFAYGMHYFAYQGKHYLAVAAERSATGDMSTSSAVFTWNGCTFS